jgi:hypothetical protein
MVSFRHNILLLVGTWQCFMYILTLRKNTNSLFDLRALGQQGFNFLADGRLVAQYSKDGKSVLVVADVSNKDGLATNIQEYGMEDGLPMMFGGIVPTDGNDVYFIGGSPSTPPSVYKWNIETKGAAEILACSTNLSFDDDIISIPRQVEFPTTLGTAFGYYYPPKNGCHTGMDGEAPPLLVKAHGGPTACTGTSFNPAIQYWTSRGFAVLDVDYGGSTGYGRDYRRRLRKVRLCVTMSLFRGITNSDEFVAHHYLRTGV